MWGKLRAVGRDRAARRPVLKGREERSQVAPSLNTLHLRPLGRPGYVLLNVGSAAVNGLALAAPLR